MSSTEGAERELNVKLRNAILKDVKTSVFFRDLINDLNKNFLEDADAIKEIMEHYTGLSSEEFDKLITKNRRKDKKTEDKFKPKGLKKPSITGMFATRFKAQCDKKGVKYTNEAKIEAYKNLSEKEKTKLRNEVDTLIKEYNEKVEEQRQKAISNGEIPADKPKRPLNGYMRFANVVRSEITEQFSDEPSTEKLTKITSEIGVRWNALSDKEKAKYNDPYKKELEAFNVVMKQWQLKETDRKKKQDSTDSFNEEEKEVKIETAGKASATSEKKKETNETKAKNDSKKKEEPVESEADEPEPEPEPETEEPEEEIKPMKTVSKKTETKKVKSSKA